MASPVIARLRQRLAEAIQLTASPVIARLRQRLAEAIQLLKTWIASSKRLRLPRNDANYCYRR